jgi:hypothetical protein
MEIKTLRKLAKLKKIANLIKKKVIFLIETTAYLISYIFLSSLLLWIIYFMYKALVEYEILRYYATGIMTMIALWLSITFIKKYNNKYRKHNNDSNSSKRQDYFIFEENIRK